MDEKFDSSAALAPSRGPHRAYGLEAAVFVATAQRAQLGTACCCRIRSRAAYSQNSKIRRDWCASLNLLRDGKIAASKPEIFARVRFVMAAAAVLRNADSVRGRHHRLLPTSTSSRPITIPPYISVKMVGIQRQHASVRHPQFSSTQHEGQPCRSSSSDRPHTGRRLDLA